MKHSAATAILAVTVMATTVCGRAVAQSPKLEIDLIAATLNGKVLFEYSLDEITDLLGRPSSVENPRVAQYGPGEKPIKVGASLFYLDRGLSFHFEHPDIDSSQKCRRGFFIYLSRVFNKEAAGFFMPYNGKLTKNFDGSWKTKKVMEEFSDYKPEDRYNEESIRKQKAETEEMIQKLTELAKLAGRNVDNEILRIRKSEQTSISYSTQIWMLRDTHLIIMEYEENTKFVERVSLNFRQQPKKN